MQLLKYYFELPNALNYCYVAFVLQDPAGRHKCHPAGSCILYDLDPKSGDFGSIGSESGKS
jgi:hypothetical protein